VTCVQEHGFRPTVFQVGSVACSLAQKRGTADRFSSEEKVVRAVSENRISVRQN
jgi:hypothetical protein